MPHQHGVAASKCFLAEPKHTHQEGLGFAGMRGLNIAFAEVLGMPATTAAANLPLSSGGWVKT